ncbi:MAG TPA: NAD(+) diphosphatase [Gammaproteobacteria bacterium]|nr:NAD(+) diphosphatase [Gammaproteobacteria bacterium]
MNPSGETPFVFAAPELDRLSARRDDATWLEQALAAERARFVAVAGDSNLIVDDGGHPRALLLRRTEADVLLPDARCVVFLGEWRGHACFALGLDEGKIVPGAEPRDLRQVSMLLEDAELALLGYARAMTHWHGTHLHCGRCGAPTRSLRAGHERACSACNLPVFPRLDPAVIVLVTHGERCLLGRQKIWPPHRYATLAGFVEPGESLESALRREVEEETNVHLGAIHYRSSQPWPFPRSLMLGFRAEALTTDIRYNDGELEHAAWFSRADIVQAVRDMTLLLSPSRSISYRLIRDWFEEHPDYSFTDLPYVDPYLAQK